MSFSQALSGLRAAATNLDVVGNNIANSQTVGFKASKAQFADVFADADVGLGTKVSSILQNFSNGDLENTERDMDLAINGSGFFRFMQEEQAVYSRNGQLTMTSDGFLTNAQGARLTGYPAGVGTGGEPTELRIPAGSMQAQATSSMDLALNLDSGAEMIDRDAMDFDQDNSSSYSYANSVTAYDSLGNQQNLLVFFSRVGENEWEVRTSREGELADEVGTLEFNNNGLLTSTDGLDEVTFNPGNGADAMQINMNMEGTTQFANAFELADAGQDGYAAGSLINVFITNDGRVQGNYSNEQTRSFGTIALANFSNVEGLQTVGDNAWRETSDSGAPLLGIAGEGSFGSVESGVVENSNVDLTQELVDMIIAQRNYQANAQSIRTQDEVLQTISNLR